MATYRAAIEQRDQALAERGLLNETCAELSKRCYELGKQLDQVTAEMQEYAKTHSFTNAQVGVILEDFDQLKVELEELRGQ